MKNLFKFLLVFLLCSTAVYAHIGVVLHPAEDVGISSWYGHEWTTTKAHPRRGIMANGKAFDPIKMTAASFVYPLGAKIEVTNVRNGRKVRVTITDRGPAERLERLIDVSERAAMVLGFHNAGLAIVAVRVLSIPAPKVKITVPVKIKY